MRILILIFGFKGLSIDVFEGAHQLKVTFCLHSWAVVLTEFSRKIASLRLKTI